MTTDLARCAALCGGDTAAATLMSRLLFWQRRAFLCKGAGPPYVVFSRARWCDDTGLTLKQFTRALAALQRSGLVESDRGLWKNRVTGLHRLAGPALALAGGTINCAPEGTTDCAPEGTIYSKEEVMKEESKALPRGRGRARDLVSGYQKEHGLDQLVGGKFSQAAVRRVWEAAWAQHYPGEPRAGLPGWRLKHLADKARERGGLAAVAAAVSGWQSLSHALTDRYGIKVGARPHAAVLVDNWDLVAIWAGDPQPARAAPEDQPRTVKIVKPDAKYET